MTEPDSRGDASSSPSPTGNGGLPVLPPVMALIEILVLVVLPGALDLVIPAFPALNEMHPHFFWLPVLLLTLQYGTTSGLVAAGTAILFTALLGWPEQEIGENHFNYLLRIWLQPVLWLSTAVLLGQFRLRQIERKETLIHAVAELTQQRQAIAEHARHLRARCERLERVIAAGESPTAHQLLAALGTVNTAEPAEAIAAVHRAMELGFGDCTISVWVVDGSALRLSDRHGPARLAVDRELFAAGEPLHEAIVERGRHLSVLVPGEERDLGGAGVAAVPILGPARSVLGMLLLEMAAPGEIDAGTTHRLATLARVVADRMRDTQSTLPAPPPRPVLLQVAEPPTRHRIWRQVKWRDSGPGRRARISGRTG